MRLSVVTDEISQDLAVALRLMAEYGIHEAELRNVYNKYIVDAENDLLDRVSSELKRYGMTVPCVDTPIFNCDLAPIASLPAGRNFGASAPVPDNQMRLLQRSIDLCRRFECAYLRIFSFWKRGSLSPDIEDRIADSLVRPAEIAARAGVTLLLENEPACFLATGKETARVIEKVGASSLKMLWDPGNAYMAGEQPYPSGFNVAAKHVAHVHLKDARSDDAGRLEWTVFGEGEIDYAGQFKALAASGYDGAVSLEAHYRGANGNKEEASRQCLDGLVRLASAI